MLGTCPRGGVDNRLPRLRHEKGLGTQGLGTQSRMSPASDEDEALASQKQRLGGGRGTEPDHKGHVQGQDRRGQGWPWKDWGPQPLHGGSPAHR